jgi:hypothetical protein
MEIETLESLFRKGIRQYEVQFNKYPPISMIIGDGHIFTTGVTKGNPYDPDNACIELFERKGVLFINSYYDDPDTTCTVIDHVLMFRVLKLIAKHMGFTRIELLDGSRKKTGTGCEWDLRILNRLYKGEGTLTFYEKHGFVPLADPLKRMPRFTTFVRQLHDNHQAYIDENGITSLKELAEHMYALCNIADFSSTEIDGKPLSVFFKDLSDDIKETIARGISVEETMSYSFHVDPSLPSHCDLRRAVFPIRDGVDPTHGTGIIRFLLEPETLVDQSYRSGGRRRRTRKVTRF